MWSAEIIRRFADSGQFTVVVQYTDGTRVIKEPITTSNPAGNWPYTDIYARVEQLEAQSAKTIPLGPVVLPTPPVVDEAARAYGELITRARHLTRMKDLGIAAGNADLTSVLAQLEAGYKPEYESLF